MKGYPMSYIVTNDDIFNTKADAAVLGVEDRLDISEGKVFSELAARGGERLSAELKKLRMLPVGKAVETEPCGLPFEYLILAASPRWNYGIFDELGILRSVYRSIYEIAEKRGIKSIAMPFLSANYYYFPQEAAMHTAFLEADRHDVETVFLAEKKERFDLREKALRKPKILYYAGYYRDYAAFRLDSDMYAFVDIRPENKRVWFRSFMDGWYRISEAKWYTPLSESEIERVRRVYEDHDW